MHIETKKESFNRIEITLSDYEINESPNWEDFKAEFLHALVKEYKSITLLTRRANKESVLWELGKPSEDKCEDNKFLWLSKNDITFEQCKLIAEDYEFYLGGFFIAFIEPEQLFFSDFIKHLFSSEMRYKFSKVEYMFMGNDGETFNWINPNNTERILKQLAAKNLILNNV